MADSQPRRIGIHLFDDVEELDAVGPWEVLAYWTRNAPEDGWEVFTFADDLRPVRCAQGLRLLPDRTTAELPALDVLLHPGGQGTRRLLADPAHLDWVRDRRSTTPLMTSVSRKASPWPPASVTGFRA